MPDSMNLKVEEQTDLLRIKALPVFTIEVDDAAAQADLSGVAEEVSRDLNDKKD